MPHIKAKVAKKIFISFHKNKVVTIIWFLIHFYCLQLLTEGVYMQREDVPFTVTWAMKKRYIFLKWSLLSYPVSILKSVCTIAFLRIKSTKQDPYLICFEVVLCVSQVILIASSNLYATMQQLIYKTRVQIDRWFLLIQLNNIHRWDVSNLYYIATYVVFLFFLVVNLDKCINL